MRRVDPRRRTAPSGGGGVHARSTIGEPSAGDGRPLVAVFAASTTTLPRVVGTLALAYAAADVLVTRSARCVELAQPDVLLVADHGEATDAVVAWSRAHGIPIVRVVSSRATTALEPGVVALDADARLTAVSAKLDAAIHAPRPRILLTDRERAVLSATVDGRSPAQIADDLSIDVDAVRLLLRRARAAVRADGHATSRDDLEALARRGAFRRPVRVA